MNLYTFLIAMLAPVLATIVSDLTGYERARREYNEALIQHRKDQIAYPFPPIAPDFDWPLFWTRLAIGLLTGLGSAAGVSAFAD